MRSLVLSALARRAGALGLAALLAMNVAPAAAQSAGGASRPLAPEAGRDGPRKPPPDRRTQLDALFEALRLAPDEDSAKALDMRLEAMFSQTGSPSADLLMARAEIAKQAKEYDLSLELLDAAIAVAPDNLGLLMSRATVKYQQDDYEGALADLGEVLTREPRHYTALLGLALVMRDVDEDASALKAARQAVAINPHLKAAKDLVDELSIEVEGREI